MWLDSLVAEGVGNFAGFLGAGVSSPLDTLTVTLENSRSIGSMSFADTDIVNSPAGWVLKSQSPAQVLTLEQVGTFVPSINVNNLGTGNNIDQFGNLFRKIANVTANLAGNQGFNKTGGGSLVLGGNNAGLSGSVTLDGGVLVLNSANALGSATLITQRNGQLSFRGDVARDFSGIDVIVTGDSTFGTGNSISEGAVFGAGQNINHTIGDVSVTKYGTRELGISGSNGYGLSIGALTFVDGLNLINQGDNGTDPVAGNSNNVNGLGSGLVTIASVVHTGPTAGTLNFGGAGSFAGDITVSTSLTSTGGGSLALVHSGARTVTINGTIGTGGDTYVTGGTTGSVVNNNYQASVGTMIIGTGTVPVNSAITINGGSLLINSAVTSTISGLTMGGATLTTGPVPAYMSTGSGTLSVGANGITVNNSIQFDVANTLANVTATSATLNGRLDLGGASDNITVHGNSTLTIGANVSGAGGINKLGTGDLNLNPQTGSNTFTGALNIVDGTVSGIVLGGGNHSLGGLPSGADVTLGGALRLNGGAAAGTGTIDVLTSSDTGLHSGLIIDGTANAATLNINNFNYGIPDAVSNRTAGTRGTIKVTGVTGSLNTNEVINLSTNGPVLTSGMAPAYMAGQYSGSNTQLSFLTVSSNRLALFPEASYISGVIGLGVTTDVFHLATSQALGGAKTVHALRMAQGVTLDGPTTLTLGSAGAGFGGLIMNGSAVLNAPVQGQNAATELVIWSGGAARNTITNLVRVQNGLTTAGLQELNLTGTVSLQGTSNPISVTGSTLTLSGNSALSGSNGLLKTGGGILAVTGTNTTYSGGVTVRSGTLQLGAGGATGAIGSGAIVNNANVTYNVFDPLGATYSHNMSGTGHVWVNPGAANSTGIVTLDGTLSYTGNTTVQTGTLRTTAAERLPTGTALRVETGATFSLAGTSNNQTVANLSGGGTIVAGSAGASNATLTVNGGGTFSGSLRNGAAGGLLGLTKTGPGTLILSGANAFNQTISVNSGTLQLNSAAAGASGNGNPNIVLNGGALQLAHSDNMANASYQILGTSTISVVGDQTVQLGGNQEGGGGGPAIFLNSNSVTGGGTVVLALNGRTLHFGHRNPPTTFDGSTTALALFSGTIKFADNNPLGSQLRFGVNGTNPGAQTQATLTTFDFGNGHLLMHFRNGTGNFNIGRVQGGTNSILEGHTNGGGRWTSYNFGFLGGDQTFHGQIRDMTTNGANGIVHVQKMSSGTMTLKNTLSFTGGITVNAGTLFLASGANVTNSGSMVTNGGTLAILNGASITSPRMLATVNPNFPTGGINLSAFGAPGFPTPQRMTYIGGGTIYGNANHNGGSINPGIIAGAGTLTFNDSLFLNNGSVDFDLTAGSAGLLGTSGLGSNDVLKINASNGLSLNSGIIRLNFIGSGTTPPPTLSVGQFYPIIKHNGIGAGTLSNILTVAKFRGSFGLEEGTGTLAGVIGAKVLALGGAPNHLRWTPVAPEFNAWDAAVGFTNYVPLGGGGSVFFFNGDSITFDDSTTIRTVQMTPDLAPAAITVNTENDYIFTGLGFGSIVGSTGITKNGTGTLWLAGQNTFTGGITVNGGTLVGADPLTSFIVQPRNQFAGGTSGGGTVVFNGNSDYRFTSPGPNTFSGPDGGNFVWNAGSHELIIAGSNQPHGWSANFHGVGTVVIRRPGLDNNNSNINFQADDLVSFFGTLKMNDLTDFFATSNQQSGLRDGTIIRPQGGGNPSMILDMGGSLSSAGLQLTAANQTFTMGSLRGGANTTLKPNGNNTAGTFNIAGVGSQYNGTFGGVFKAINGANTAPGGGVNDAVIMLAHVVKSGSNSTLTLTQSQPYVGNTIVSGGTLALVGPQTNLLVSPTITIGTNGVLDVSGLDSGGGNMVLIGGQRLISNGAVVGSSVLVPTGATVGGTNFGVPLIVLDDGTIAPGNSVGTMVVSSLNLAGEADWIIELDGSGMDSVLLTEEVAGEIAGTNQFITLLNIGGFTPGNTYTFLDYNGDPGIVGQLDILFKPQEFAYDVKVVHDSVNTRVNFVFTDNTAQWFTDSNDTWGTGFGNRWTTDGVTAQPTTFIPNGVTFGTFISAPRTVTMQSIGIFTNSVAFNSPHKYTIAGTSTLTLDSGVTAPINVVQGSHAITAPVRALRNLGLSIAPGSNLSFGGTIINANGAGIVKTGGGSVTFTRLNMPGGTLDVRAGSILMLQKGSPNSVQGTNLLLTQTIMSGASVDLTNNAMIFDFSEAVGTTSFTELRDLRVTLQDNRMFSSTATANQSVGYRLNNVATQVDGTGTNGLGLATVATFAGVATDNTSILLRVTYDGDTNLDGIVNVHDLYNLSINWLVADAVWAAGDFNYDGIVNKVDLGLMAQNWHQGYGSPLPSSDIDAALAAVGIPFNAVPEPSTMALAGLGAVGLLSRRRRRD